MTDTYTVVNPATATPVTDVPLADLARTDAAIERAHEAFLSWRAMAPGERATLLRRFAAVVDDHIEELAELEVRNAGHTWGNARWEAGNVRDCLNYYSGGAGAALRPADPGRRRHRHHLPRAARRGRHHRAVELPDADRRLGLRPGAGRRQHGGPQAGRADAAHRDPAR